MILGIWFFLAMLRQQISTLVDRSILIDISKKIIEKWYEITTNPVTSLAFHEAQTDFSIYLVTNNLWHGYNNTKSICISTYILYTYHYLSIARSKWARKTKKLSNIPHIPTLLSSGWTTAPDASMWPSMTSEAKPSWPPSVRPQL
jgi:hypothetical protein